jgi:hypothetical protein
MSDAVVVCFRAPEVEGGAALLEGFRRLIEDAKTRGASLVGFGPTQCAFELKDGDEAAAIELAMATIRLSMIGGDLAVGIGRGVLERLSPEGAPLPAVSGPAYARAFAFARAARPAEILVDPSLAVAQRGDLLTVGSRVGIYGRQRFPALLLDTSHPWRTKVERTGGQTRQARLVGRPETSTLTLKAGSLGVVRARRGHGGTRFLEAIEQGLEPARILRITPHPFAEPLGALRRAMLRAVTMGHAPLNLTAQQGEGLDAVLAGEGLDPDSSTELLVAWLTPDSADDARGVVIVDDADEVDADTLEVVARAARASGEAFRVIVHIGGSDPVPKPFANLPLAFEIRLGPLSHADATRIAQDSVSGDLATDIANRWAVRGGRLPLGIVESVRQSVESGEIAWENGRPVVRARAGASAAAVPMPPKHWVKKRLSYHDEGARRVLEALAVLGGSAESRDVLEVVRRREELEVDASTALVVLEAALWIVRVKPDVVALASTTHRDAVLATLSDAEFQAWHRAASATFARKDRPLVVAAATVHAILASDPGRALELSRKAAAATRAIGLESTADAFERFYERQDVSLLVLRNLFSSQLEIARALPSIWPEEMRADSQAPRTASSIPPRGDPPREAADSIIVLEGSDIEELKGDVAVTPPARGTASAHEETRAAVEALRNGDLEAVDRMAKKVRLDENRTGLAERLSAMAKLARGETGDAIRRLRVAAEESRRTKSRDRCRASLALGVALAAANRHDEALLETLDALARARETADARGVHACSRFLSQLASTVGHHDVAEAWASVTG